jgi:hypothetical protein
VSAAKGPSSRRNAGRGGSRPAGRPASSPGSAGRSGGRPSWGTREQTPGVRTTGPKAAAFPRNRALRILGGLLVFTSGFAVAAVLVVAGQQVTPPYYAAIVVGVAGLAVAGVAMARGLPPMPETPIWSRDTLGLLSSAAGLRPLPVIVTLYLLTLLGVLGNLVYPLVFGVG